MAFTKRGLLRALYVIAAVVLSVVAIVAVAEAAANPAPAGTVRTVDTCTQANFDAAYAAAVDGDTIWVRCSTSSPATPGTLLFSSIHTVAKSITVSGKHAVSGYNAISGGDSTSLFVISAGKRVTMTEITLRDGVRTGSGGCVDVRGTLIGYTVTVKSCSTLFSLFVTVHGGGIYVNGGVLTLTASTVVTNFAFSDGGGIYALNSHVGLVNTLVGGNRSGSDGGGVAHANGTSRYEYADVISNTAVMRGGGIYASNAELDIHDGSRVQLNTTTHPTQSQGTGIWMVGGSAQIQGADISYNDYSVYGGGLFATGSSLGIFRSTINNNSGYFGAGLHITASALSLYDDVLVGNNGYEGGALYNNGNTNAGHNLFQSNIGYDGGAIYNDSDGNAQIYFSDFLSNSAAYGGALANRGRIDYAMWLTFTANVGTYGGGAAVLSSGSRTLYTDVRFIRNRTDNGSGGAINAAGNVTVSLYNAQVLTNTANSNSAGSKSDGGGLYALDSFVRVVSATVAGNRATGLDDHASGGGMIVTGSSRLVLSDTRIIQNQADYMANGGGLSFSGPSATINNVVVANNTAQGAAYGAGIYFHRGTVTLSGASVSGNSGAYAGGGIYARNGVYNFSDLSLSQNAASAAGGGMSIFSATLNLNNVSVLNHALSGANGSGIDCYRCAGAWSGMLVRDNTSTGQSQGGGLNAYDSALSIQSATFEGNAARYGGGIAGDSTEMQLTNVTLSANQAYTSGGGIYNDMAGVSPSVLTLTHVTLKDNSAFQGGGIYNYNNASTNLFFKNSVVADSTSGGNCSGKAFALSVYSLSSDNTCTLSGSGSLNGTAANLNPLSPAVNGQWVHIPKSISLLVDRVSGSDFAPTDARGVGRPQGLGADAGAVERRASDPEDVIPSSLYLPIIRR